MSTGTGPDGVGEELLSAGFAWIDTLSRAAERLRHAADPGGQAAPSAAEPAADAGPGAADLLEAAARVQMAFLVSGLDYSRRIVELQSRHGTRVAETLMKALDDRSLSPAERRALIDEARGYTREVATATMDEARNLTTLLQEIDRRLAAAAGDATAARRARVKE